MFTKRYLKFTNKLLKHIYILIHIYLYIVYIYAKTYIYISLWFMGSDYMKFLICRLWLSIGKLMVQPNISWFWWYVIFHGKRSLHYVGTFEKNVSSIVPCSLKCGLCCIIRYFRIMSNIPLFGWDIVKSILYVPYQLFLFLYHKYKYVIYLPKWDTFFFQEI